jgi:hypothetical protein
LAQEFRFERWSEHRRSPGRQEVQLRGARERQVFS